MNSLELGWCALIWLKLFTSSNVYVVIARKSSIKLKRTHNTYVQTHWSTSVSSSITVQGHV